MDDKRKYTPDLAKVLRESDKKALDEKLNRALENPALDAAIAKVKPKLKPGEDPLFYDVNRRLSSPSLTPVNEAAAPPEERPAPEATEAPPAASPWMQEAADPAAGLDQAALPSAHLPPSTPPTSLPVPRELRGAPSPVAQPGLPKRLKSALGLLAVLAPVTIVLILTRTAPPNDVRSVPASASATAQAPTAAAPPTSASAAGEAPLPVATGVATVDAAAPPPPTPPRLSPALSAAPRPAPVPPKVGPTQDPYDTAPSAPPTPTPTATPAPPPPPPTPTVTSPKATPIF